MPKISVIVPVYKVEKYLNRCVDSILNQTFKDFEIILVDDGSPDNCPAICDDYAAKYDFVHVIHKENGGLSDARNVGIDWAFKNSDSEWITFIDSDDWIHPQFLEILFNSAIKFNVNICCSDIVYKVSETRGGFEFYSIDNLQVYKGDSEFLITKQMNTSSACSRLYMKDCFVDVRFPVGQLYEDMRTIYKVLYPCKKIAYVLNKLYYYFYNTDGIVFSKRTLVKALDEIKAVEAHLMYLFENGYYISTRYRFSHYRLLVENLVQQYEWSAVCDTFKHYCLIRKQINRKVKFLDNIYQKEKCRRRKKKRKFELDNLYNDFLIIKQQKSVLYSYLFFVKNYIKLYFKKR